MFALVFKLYYSISGMLLTNIAALDCMIYYNISESVVNKYVNTTCTIIFLIMLRGENMRF